MLNRVVGRQSVLFSSEEEGEGEGEGEREVRWRKKRGEKKIYKIMICTVTVAIVHKCTILHPPM